jgi:hypothetical protein
MHGASPRMAMHGASLSLSLQISAFRVLFTGAVGPPPQGRLIRESLTLNRFIISFHFTGQRVK